MGVGVSNWRLAQAVSKLGQLGVVSGTAIDQVLVRRLADGDKGGIHAPRIGRVSVSGDGEDDLERLLCSRRQAELEHRIRRRRCISGATRAT